MRQTVVILALFAALASASVADAGWTEFWSRVRLDWQRNNCWPEPFLHADRELVRGPLIAMTDNGWRAQNTLGNHLFTVEENKLTQAGALKVRWIVTQTPPHRRAVFVLRGETPDGTVARVETVQQEIARILPDGPRPEVLLTDIIPVGGSGEYFDAVNRARQSSIPEPRLPPATPETN